MLAEIMEQNEIQQKVKTILNKRRIDMFKLKIHSIVDVITNSSTVIYTYQDSVKEAKELVQEVLTMMGIEDKTPDDIFYYGVFCDDDTYLENDDDLPDEAPTIGWGEGTTKETREAQRKIQKDWFDAIKLSIIKGEVEKPEWMESAEEGYDDGWNPDTELHLLVKDERFRGLADKIKSLLNSVSADGGRDG